MTIEDIGIFDNDIIEGISDNDLKSNICHFPNTATFNGNICIAAHNYSIPSSDLFKNLQNIHIGSIIEYKNEYASRKYKVSYIDKISETDLSVLENTSENIITMITCVNDRKDIRLCVKAIEIKEE